MINLKDTFQMGVLGNVAINRDDFKNENSITNSLSVKSLNGVPNGLVPNYVPFKESENSFLDKFPLSHSKIQIPTIYDNLQIEPELVFECDIKYYNNSVLYIIPKRFTVYNDATLHRLSINKVSKNKNWGENSKGIAIKWLDIEKFEEGGTLSNYNIVSFIKRGGVIEPYTVDTKIENYPYLYDNLIEWTIKQIKEQKNVLSLDDIDSLIKKAGNPKKFLINIGTTLYTPIGDRTFLEDKDEVFIVMYDRTKYRSESIKAYLLAYKTRNVNYDGMVILHQRAYLEN